MHFVAVVYASFSGRGADRQLSLTSELGKSIYRACVLVHATEPHIAPNKVCRMRPPNANLDGRGLAR